MQWCRDTRRDGRVRKGCTPLTRFICGFEAGESQEGVKLVPTVVVALVRELREIRIVGDHRILRAEVGRVVDADIHLSNLSCGMEETLKCVIEKHPWSE